MARVVAAMTVSLDGFVNDRDGGVDRLYPDHAALSQSGDLRAAIRNTGAVVMGRRSYDMEEDDTGYEFRVPIFVLTHRAPDRVAKGENDHLSFTFVTDGVDRAIALAQATAGDKEVAVIGGAATVRQCLQAGLVDELRIWVRPILLGDGLRLFDPVAGPPVALETTRVTEAAGAIVLRFRVVR